MKGGKGRTRLQAEHQGGPPAHRAALKRAADAVRIAKRRRKAWDLFVGRGKTFLEIGDALGVSSKTAHEDVVAYRNEAVDRELFGSPDAMRERQVAAVEAVVEAHWKRRGRKANAEVILGALSHEARLMGLNLQRKDTFTAEQVFGLVRGITALFTEVVQDPEQRRQFTLGLKRKIGGALPPGAVVSEQGQGQEKKVG